MKLLNETVKNIHPLYKQAMKNAWKRMDKLSKPIGSLGQLEEIAVRIAGITGKVKNKVNKKITVIMCSDNGVWEEGVSACPLELTALITNNYTKGFTGIGVLSSFANSEICVVDVGVKTDFNNPKIINKKIAYGTKNMAKEPAMTREETIRAIEVGIEMVDKLVAEGYNLFGTGEAGMCNTSTSAAVISVLLDIDSDLVVGKGSGLTEEQFENKKRVIKNSIKLNNPNKEDAIDVLSKVGGFDIAGLCGCFLGAAKNRVPIVIDGIISYAAALCAYKICGDVKDFMFPSHLPVEPGAEYAVKELELNPNLNLEMRLGEGTGCPLEFLIIEAALNIMRDMYTMEEANIHNNEFFVDIRKDK
ncbi:nicotinate-nucleotide--dimethylbenzimidazole phosphoribosyltransferase [Clostridium tepidum]|jgi:nicotinate-nucleotide--dimethylbenzimidazole phosphoribosyltransferase|uniref:Nicotinate-nucleotide--dimethylbenzimidazole phosphoribosyltransferase n=1 Tax=Clostridium tepidum TaxID=1962263 RepID=A0A1S9I881_9CLOT|nr:nicotinate-nucleotide--dimethylbenzimidazole phosphoribosyltransferase [Clostridium tepidum]MCR1935349.1 nicotinate-nucleotide--dimethylbenzimidazole phosphoribosyltransferase [Clostridium tepidum]MDU6878684.1 nicotinate-nucleotide--dimethylbenzimidazole phosphoribosyltransferase [Clostridium botulinum]OOO61552.1 nicotinate-nucleotide--dimethylbenzimidazole phosphoribosyltransferase [Clostridium tepidum]OOO66541.1 nicotinate-nucleotide--dimethylbenzimidazole phosphoribosyltransferase [Clostr